MSYTFSEENLDKITKLKTRYPSQKALCLPCLWMVQNENGFISIDAIDTISQHIDIPAMEVYRVATFYTMFHLEEKTKLQVDVCKTLSCKLCGADEILKHLESKDIFLNHVECLGSCATAPLMQINDKNYENLTIQKVDKILEDLL